MRFAAITWLNTAFPNYPGLYHVRFYDEIVYIGSATDLRKRRKAHTSTPWYGFLSQHALTFDWFYFPIDRREGEGLATLAARIRRLELGMIEEIHPRLNAWPIRLYDTVLTRDRPGVHRRIKFGPGWSKQLRIEREAMRAAMLESTVQASK